LEAHFLGRLAAVSFTKFSQRVRPIYLFEFTMQSFYSKLASDLLDEISTPTATASDQPRVSTRHPQRILRWIGDMAY
jgi:hypothetical protein